MSSLLNAYVIEPALRRLSFSHPEPDSGPPSQSSRVPDSNPGRGTRRHASSLSAVAVADRPAAAFAAASGRPAERTAPAIARSDSIARAVPLHSSGMRPAAAPAAMMPPTREPVPSSGARRLMRRNSFPSAARPTDPVIAISYTPMPQRPLGAGPVSNSVRGQPFRLDRSHSTPLLASLLEANNAARSRAEQEAWQQRTVPETTAAGPSDESEDTRPSHIPQTIRRLRQDSVASSQASALPADDGMRTLREEMHRIRDMALSSEEKAKRMHALMTADYVRFKSHNVLSEPESDIKSKSLARQPAQKLSILPTLDSVDPENPFNILPGDLEPSYCPPTPTSESDHEDLGDNDNDHEDEGLDFGCQHYKRNVKVQCADCRRWYTCRLCHDENTPDHKLVRREIKNMLCMNCNTAQAAAEYCKRCGILTAHYYCNICKLWDNDSRRRIYHCDDCGICRRGEGLGKDYVHCKKCNVCIVIAHASTHRCVERATDCDCPICSDYLFTSAASVVAMKCGHYIHQSCYDAYMETSYRCPICNRSAINMEIQWRKLDHCIEVQPMPEQYQNTKAWITCNDCAAKTCVPFHWLGNKCAGCDSYNTNQTRLVNGPEDEAGQDDTALRRQVEERGRDLFEAQPDQNSSQARPVNFRTATSSSAVGHLNVSHQSRLSDDTSTSLMDSVFPPASPVSAGPPLNDVDMADAEDNVDLSVADDEDDDAGFWGEGMSPPNWNSMNPREWTSQRFFAKSEDGADEEVLGTSPGRYFGSNNDGGGGMNWHKTRFFGAPLVRARSADAVSPVAANDDEEQTKGLGGWGIGPNWSGQMPAWLASRIPRPPFAAADDSGTGDDSGLGWRDWREWTLRAPAGGWTSPNFLASRFGGHEKEGDVDNDDDDESGGEESDSDSQPDLDGELDDGDDDEGVDLVDLPGHR